MFALLHAALLATSLWPVADSVPDFHIPAADRSFCQRLATTGGTSPTYTELLTCLELQRDARNLREQGTTGRR